MKRDNNLQVVITEELYEKLHQQKKQGQAIRYIVIQALTDYFDKKGK
jgi:hypothetical protein